MRKGWLACCALAGVVASVQADVTVTAKVLDPRFGDTVTVSPQQETYAEGTTVTLTGTLAGETVYKRWYGLPEDAVIDTAGLTAENTGVVTATFTVGTNALDVTFHSAPIWYYVKDAPCGYVTNTVVTAEDGTETTGTEFVAYGWNGIISNAVWRLNVRVNTDVGGKTLTLGRRNNCTAGEGYTGYGDGVLDLSGPIRTPAQEDAPLEEWVIYYQKGIESNAYNEALGAKNSENPTARTCFPTVFVAPETTERLGGGYLLRWDGNTRLEQVIIVSTNLVSTGYQTFMGSKLKSLILKAPALQSLGAGIGVERVNMSDLELDSVETFTCLNASYASTQTGVLRLPKVKSMGGGYSILSQNAFCSLELGTDYTPEEKVVLSINKFFSDKMLYSSSIVFGPYANISNVVADYSNRIFSGDNRSYVKTATFMGAPFEDNTTILDSLFSATPATSGEATKVCRIYASSKLGWADVADTDYTDFEKTEKAALEETLVRPQRVIGVYAGANNARKAWIIHTPSPFDPQGLMLVVR